MSRPANFRGKFRFYQRERSPRVLIPGAMSAIREIGARHAALADHTEDLVLAEPVANGKRQIAEALAAIPGVASVGYASVLPNDGLPPNWDSIGVEGRPVL